MGPHHLSLRHTSQHLDTHPPGKRFTSNGAGKLDMTTTTKTTTLCGVGTFNTFL